MNMYERYPMKFVVIGDDGVNLHPMVLDRVSKWYKDLTNDETGELMFRSKGRVLYLSEFVKENVMPNQIYMSRLMQNAVKLMEQASWNGDVFTKLWDICYANGITTRDEVLHMVREITTQKSNKREQEQNREKLERYIRYSM